MILTIKSLQKDNINTQTIILQDILSIKAQISSIIRIEFNFQTMRKNKLIIMLLIQISVKPFHY